MRGDYAGIAALMIAVFDARTGEPSDLGRVQRWVGCRMAADRRPAVFTYLSPAAGTQRA